MGVAGAAARTGEILPGVCARGGLRRPDRRTAGPPGLMPRTLIMYQTAVDRLWKNAWWNGIMLACSGLASIGCSGMLCPTGGLRRDHEGPKRPPEEIAVVMAECGTNISQLDGKLVWGPKFLELTPGKHSIQVRLHSIEMVEKEPQNLEATFGAGRHYVVRTVAFPTHRSGGSWSVTIEETHDPGFTAQWLRERNPKPKSERGLDID